MGTFHGKKHSDETRIKISENIKKKGGSKLAHWKGYFWINNGIEQKE